MFNISQREEEMWAPIEPHPGNGRRIRAGGCS